MFRAAVFSIVLSVAVGPNLALLCRTWCHAQASAGRTCHHENLSTTARMAGDENCDDVVLGVSAVLREDARRDVPPDSNHAIPVPRYRLAQSTIDARHGQEIWRDWSREKRPLLAVLRI